MNNQAWVHVFLFFLFFFNNDIVTGIGSSTRVSADNKSLYVLLIIKTLIQKMQILKK